MPFDRRAGGTGRTAAGPLWPDVLAGLTLWGVLVPEALAYAGMAGLPVAAGLYTLLASLPLYFLFGGSPVLVCAATSAESIMMAAVVAPLAGGDPVRYAALTALLVLLTGLVFLVSGLMRLGRVTSFLSKPVMTGFISGLAVYIAANQLHKLLGLPRGHGDTFMQVLQLAADIGRCNQSALAVGLSALALLFALERWTPRLPAGFCVMALGIAVSRLLDLEARHGVEVVRGVATGLPGLVAPAWGIADVRAVFPAAVGLALVAFSQALGAAESYARRFGSRVDADRELRALGLANLGSAFLGGLLAGGSMSSTAVNVAAGARSRVSSLATAVLVVLTLCFLTPVFAGLPESVLGAVVMHAVIKLFKLGELRRYRAINRYEFVLSLIALLGVVVLDILPGLVLAVSASLLRLIVFASGVGLSVLGRLDGCAVAWVDTALHPGAREIPGLKALRMEGALFFANAEKFHDAVLARCGAGTGVRVLVLQLMANRRLCVTGADMLRELAGELRAMSVRLVLVDLAPQALRMLRDDGVMEIVGEDNVYPSVELAAAAVEGSLVAGAGGAGGEGSGEA
ncbi:SulP family inorganic anion transporter [Solidesulfovibrio sp.]|uniref:SulP family inorganic anion transporter n=1 Tax=Solidesulfovibrio sp. TaxID=2910990 RepID=UPI002626E93A|nr:SulP family inorganic anion transporter [Solidesulfovibrio sp.]